MELEKWVQLLQEVEELREERWLEPLHLVRQRRPVLPLLARLQPLEVVPRLLRERVEPVDAQPLAQLEELAP